MAFTLVASELRSRVIRSRIVQEGVRRLSLNAFSEQPQEQGGTLRRIFDYTKRFTGFVISSALDLLKGLAFSVRDLFTGVVKAVQFLWRFNWRITDEVIDAKILNAYYIIGGGLGGFTGRILGWLSCGAIPGASIFVFNQAMALYVLKNVGEEALEDVAAEAASLINLTTGQLLTAAVLYAYKNVRSFLLNPANPVTVMLLRTGIISRSKYDQFIEEAGKPEPWSFAIAFQNKIDSIESPFVQNFVENLVDEFFDSCVEAGYVVAGSIDEFLALDQIQELERRGQERRVEIVLGGA